MNPDADDRNDLMDHTGRTRFISGSFRWELLLSYRGRVRMIYTLTTNPAIDYHMDLTETGLMPGQINRSAKEEMYPGGKGLNVSVVLSRLGIENKAWGFIAGKTGTLLETLAMEQGCDCDFIRLPEGETRINVKLDCEQETVGIDTEHHKKKLSQK